MPLENADFIERVYGRSKRPICERWNYSVLVRVVQRGVSRSSGAQADLSYHQAWTLRGGRVIRIDVILDEKDALEAVGLA